MARGSETRQNSAGQHVSKIIYSIVCRRAHHLVVPCFINGSKMFCSLFDQGNQDQTHEIVGYPVLLHHRMDFVYQDDGKQGDQSQRDGQCNDTFTERKFGFGQIFFPISVFLLVGRKNIIEDAIVAFGVVPDESV